MFLFPITISGWKLRFKAKILFEKIVDRSRTPVFYLDFGVPDTLDGRFEMIAMHTGLAVNRIRYEGRTGTRLAQSIFDEMFLNMELSCRQMGIGDMGVPRHIKRMMVAFQGRALHYEDAAKQGEAELVETLKRNLYGTIAPPSEAVLKKMAAYIIACQSQLQTQTFEELAKGNIQFASLPAMEGHHHNETNKAA